MFKRRKIGPDGQKYKKQEKSKIKTETIRFVRFFNEIWSNNIKEKKIWKILEITIK